MDLWEFPQHDIVRQASGEIAELLFQRNQMDEKAQRQAAMTTTTINTCTTKATSHAYLRRCSMPARPRTITSVSTRATSASKTTTTSTSALLKSRNARKLSLSSEEIQQTLHFISIRDSVEMQHSWHMILELLEQVKIRDAEIQQLSQENVQLASQLMQLQHQQQQESNRSDCGDHCHDEEDYCYNEDHEAEEPYGEERKVPVAELYNKLHEYAFPRQQT